MEATTQTDCSDNVQFYDSQNMEDVAEREMNVRARREFRAHQFETEQRLLAMADMLAAQSDAVANSGSALSRCLNELARDVLEANQIVSRREKDIAEINDQLSTMGLSFAHAHAGLSRAQALVGDIIDGGLAQIHRQRSLATMEQALQGVRVVLGDEKVDGWDREKVDGILEASRCPHTHCSEPLEQGRGAIFAVPS